jgi:hypothetical protein
MHIDLGCCASIDEVHEPPFLRWSRVRLPEGVNFQVGVKTSHLSPQQSIGLSTSSGHDHSHRATMPLYKCGSRIWVRWILLAYVRMSSS